MNRPTKRIYDCVTGETIEREFTDQEFTQWQKDIEQLEVEKVEAEAKAQAKAALLAQLGITEEQAKLLLS